MCFLEKRKSIPLIFYKSRLEEPEEIQIFKKTIYLFEGGRGKGREKESEADPALSVEPNVEGLISQP